MHAKGSRRGRRPANLGDLTGCSLPYKRTSIPSFLQNPNPDVKFDKMAIKPSLFGRLLRAPPTSVTSTKLLTLLRVHGKHTKLGTICRGLEIVRRLG